MQSGFGTLSEADMDHRRLYESVVGFIPAQYGLSTPDTYRASVRTYSSVGYRLSG